jgi:hypothetical protein
MTFENRINNEQKHTDNEYILTNLSKIPFGRTETRL